MAQNLYQWNFPPVSPPCKVYGIVGHTSVECQLGSVVTSPEQVNYAQYNQGFSNSQKNFKPLKIFLDNKQHHPVLQTTKESLKNPTWNFC